MTSTQLPRRVRRALRTLFAAGAAIGLVSTAQLASAAAAPRTCTPPKYPGLGYFTSLSVSGTTCATGVAVAFAYYRCRTRSGPAGRCTTPVLGFRCHEIRNSIPTEIDARVTCTRPRATVVHTYQQDL